jgi:hypothetical protein
MTKEKDASNLEMLRSAVRRARLVQDAKVDPNLRGLFQSDAGSDADPSENRHGEVDPVLPPDVFTAAPAPRNLLQAHEVSAAVDRYLRGATVKPSSLAGDFSLMPFPDVVTMLEMGRRPGILAITTPSAIGQLFFDVGELVHAVFGDLIGPEAFYRLLEEPSGQFEFSPHPCPIAEDGRTIRGSVTGLLMEGARLVDTAALPDSRIIRAKLSARTPINALSMSRGGARPALSPTPELGGAFELDIVDTSIRAEFLHWSRAALDAWTQAELGTTRMHIHLFAEVAAGISALLGLSAPGSDAALLRGLESGGEAFGVCFQYRDGRQLDLILIDIKNPLAVGESLSRVPCVALLAPPHGDLRSIGARARVELETVLGSLPPSVLLGIGDTSVDIALQEIKAGFPSTLATVKWPGALGDRRTDLRVILADGIRQWALQRVLDTIPPMSAPFIGRY